MHAQAHGIDCYVRQMFGRNQISVSKEISQTLALFN